MVRTKADRVPRKAGGKASTKFGESASKKSSGKAISYAGGNPYHKREASEWQKRITSFMDASSIPQTENDASSSSKEPDHDVEKAAKKQDDKIVITID